MTDPMVQVVDGDEQDVRLLCRGRGCDCVADHKQQDDEQKAEADVEH